MPFVVCLLVCCKCCVFSGRGAVCCLSVASVVCFQVEVPFVVCLLQVLCIVR